MKWRNNSRRRVVRRSTVFTRIRSLMVLTRHRCSSHRLSILGHWRNNFIPSCFRIIVCHIIDFSLLRTWIQSFLSCWWRHFSNFFNRLVFLHKSIGLQLNFMLFNAHLRRHLFLRLHINPFLRRIHRVILFISCKLNKFSLNLIQPFLTLRLYRNDIRLRSIQFRGRCRLALRFLLRGQNWLRLIRGQILGFLMALRGDERLDGLALLSGFYYFWGRVLDWLDWVEVSVEFFVLGQNIQRSVFL